MKSTPLWMMALASGLALLLWTATSQAAGDAPLHGSRQLVLVRAAGWDSVPATLQRYARQDDAAPWQAVGEPIAVSLGRSGLGWGRGLHPQAALPGEPEKREGDGRAPAGLFALTGAFAADPAETRTAMPLLAPTDASVCVDDVASAFYNTVQPRTLPAKDWNSAEDMLRPDGLYRFGLFAAHNQNPVTAGAGSCIFLHIARGPGQPTAGCTAMTTEAIRELLAWLTPQAAPVLAQLPEPAYQRLRQAWALP